jgi:hypothetical protein
MTTKFQRLQNTVVTVWSETGRGSGFIISRDGLVLTNQHVVGPSEYIALQFDHSRKIAAVVLAADPRRDMAILWCDLSLLSEAIPVEIASATGTEPALLEGERVFTIGSPLNQRKVITSGIVSKIEAKAIISDININHGNSGGPLFNSLGQVVGITTFGDLSQQGGPGISGIVRIEEGEALLIAARAKMATTIRPTPTLLPVDPLDTFPIDAINAAIQQEKFDAKPYLFSQGDFEVSLITPVLKYYEIREGEMRALKEKGKRNKKATAVQGSFRPLDDLRNWAEYLGEYRPVLLIRASPKLRETTGSAITRGLAAYGGVYGGAAKLRYKTDFCKMTLTCGSQEVAPIHPGKIAHVIDVRNGLVNATDATYEGFYAYPADAISPSCGRVILRLFSEKDPNESDARLLDKKTVDRVWQDFEPYRLQVQSSVTQ